ncbi:MAG: hypothetical protein ABIT37_14095 [Luteolibacter sp.]
MKRWLFAGLAGLGLFAAGFLMGRQGIEKNAGLSLKPDTTRLPNERDSSGPLAERTRTRSAQRPIDEKNSSYSKIVDMVSRGELRISGVDINSENFMPGEKMAEFFGLSGEQLAEMKRLGLERLREKQNHEQTLAKIQEVSESGMVLDLPADPAFAAAEAAKFTESISQSFGPDVADMLQTSVKEVYRDFDAPRHVRYNMTRNDSLANLPANAPQEIRAMQEGLRDFKVSINQDEDGSYMKDPQGMILPNSGSSSGTYNLNDTTPDAYRPRYHDLWEREMGRK